MNTYVTIKDSYGWPYPIKVTTTWDSKSSKPAQLRSIVIRENGFPKGPMQLSRALLRERERLGGPAR